MAQGTNAAAAQSPAASAPPIPRVKRETKHDKWVKERRAQEARTLRTLAGILTDLSRLYGKQLSRVIFTDLTKGHLTVREETSVTINAGGEVESAVRQQDVWSMDGEHIGSATIEIIAPPVAAAPAQPAGA